MPITKVAGDDVQREPAHNGEGERKVYLQSDTLNNSYIEIMTVGFLPPGACFNTHSHIGLDEIMYVVKGYGFIETDAGRHTYKPGDCFVFPARAPHALKNTSAGEAQFTFVRIRSR